MKGKFTEILGTRGQALAVPLTTTNATAATNTDVEITIDPEDGMSVLIFGFSAFYDAVITGVLTITDGVETAKFPIVNGAFTNHTHPIQFGTGLTVTATLSAETGAVGDLSIFHAISSGKGG